MSLVYFADFIIIAIDIKKKPYKLNLNLSQKSWFCILFFIVVVIFGKPFTATEIDRRITNSWIFKYVSRALGFANSLLIMHT